MALRSVRALVAALALGLSTSCDVPQDPQPSLEIGVVGPMTHLDPARADEPGSAIVARFAFQTLPAISQKIERLRDPNGWAFTLKPGLRFSDGTPLDAGAVVANLSRWASAPSSFPAYARTFPAGSSHAIVGTTTIGPRIVDVTTRAPFPKLVRALSDPHFSLGSPTAFANAATFDERPVGSGLYAVSAFVAGDRAVLALRSEDASADGPEPAFAPRYASVRIDRIPDPHTAILSLDKNDASVVYGFPEAYLDEARADRMNPVRESPTGLWCAFAVGLAKRLRACPPGASQTVPRAEGSAP